MRLTLGLASAGAGGKGLCGHPLHPPCARAGYPRVWFTRSGSSGAIWASPDFVHSPPRPCLEWPPRGGAVSVQTLAARGGVGRAVWPDHKAWRWRISGAQVRPPYLGLGVTGCLALYGRAAAVICCARARWASVCDCCSLAVFAFRFRLRRPARPPAGTRSPRPGRRVGRTAGNPLGQPGQPPPSRASTPTSSPRGRRPSKLVANSSPGGDGGSSSSSSNNNKSPPKVRLRANRTVGGQSQLSRARPSGPLAGSIAQPAPSVLPTRPATAPRRPNCFRRRRRTWPANGERGANCARGSHLRNVTHSAQHSPARGACGRRRPTDCNLFTCRRIN